jgi:hypothetical protein
MRNLANARNQMKDDLPSGLKQLRDQQQQQRNEEAANNLEDLRDFLKDLRDELKRLKDRQQELMREGKTVPDSLLKEIEAKQRRLDQEEEGPLQTLRRLQRPDKAKRMKRRPEFPDRPYTPEAGEEKVRPREEDTPEPDKGPKDNGQTNQGNNPDKKGGDDEPKFEPALGGPKPKLDPRYANKQRPVPKGGPKTPQDQRDDLQAHQNQQMQDLNSAEQSAQSDIDALDKLLDQMKQAMKGGKDGKGGQMPQSAAMQKAMAMAAAMQQAKGQGQAQTPNLSKMPSEGPSEGNLHGGTGPESLHAELAKLDPATRNVILRMPPQVREQLLQGMREEGPEGYQRYIQNYFRRLTEVNRPKTP